MYDKPWGYQVDTGKIHDAGQAAIGDGESISALATDIDLACTMPGASAGLDIGPALIAVNPLWQAHLRAIGAGVRRIGTTLSAVSANYDSTESAIGRALQEIRP